MTAAWILLALAPLVPLSITLFNVATWSRGRAARYVAGRVSVLVPARNEAAHVEACLRSLAASEQPVHEIVVCDDQSTDATPEILARLQRELPGLRVIAADPPPPGWVGKPNACHALAQAARGDVFVFVDADTRVLPDGLGRLLSFLDPCAERPANLVSAVPEQQMESFGERLMLPLLLLTYTSWLPLRLVSESADPRLTAANGQLLAIDRPSYAHSGGFAAVAHEIVDDVALCRHAKRSGLRVVFADGSRMARCRMYGSLRALWQGFGKNLYEGIGATPWALTSVIVLHLWLFVLPYVVLCAAWLADSRALQALVWPAAVGVAANVALRAVLALRYRQPVAGLLLHPLSVLGLCALACSSWLRSRRGELSWAGRRYASRAERVRDLAVSP